MLQTTTTDPNAFWDDPADAHVVTTNLVISKKNVAIMGGGVARQAAERYPGLPAWYGQNLNNLGSWSFDYRERVLLYAADQNVVLFPTKRHFGNPSPLRLVVKSTVQLIDLADQYEWDTVNVPAPGCGLGGLSWTKDVEPILNRLLDDRFTVWHLK